jgi:predicted RNA binding protein YcfA (HicA-like mRNA interferase family)
VTASEPKRWLKAQGCRFEHGVILGSRVTFLPRHPKQETKTGTLKSVLKDLKLKM